MNLSPFEKPHIQAIEVRKTSWEIFILLLGELGRPQALGPWPSPSQRYCWRMLGLVVKNNSKMYTQYNRWATRARKFIEARVHSQNVSVGECKRELNPWGLGFCRLWAVVNERMEYSLLGAGKQDVVLFLPNLVRAFLSWHHYLRPVQFDPATCGAPSGHASNCPESWPGLPHCWPPVVLWEPK